MHAAAPSRSCDLFHNELGKRRRSVSRRAEQRLEVRCAGIVGDLLQTDRVKLALGGADAAADAETFVYNCRAAVQTAARLDFQLLFGECSAEIAEPFSPRPSRSRRRPFCPGRCIKAVDGNACGGGVLAL